MAQSRSHASLTKTQVLRPLEVDRSLVNPKYQKLRDKSTKSHGVLILTSDCTKMQPEFMKLAFCLPQHRAMRSSNY